MPNQELLLKAGDIVAAYVGRNEMPAEEVPAFLKTISDKLAELSGEKTGPERKPAVPIEESYTDDYIVCLEDGKKVSLLGRYIRTHFNLSPEEYRERWGLPEDYPFVAKSYSEKRSQIAREQGLGKS